MNHPKKVFLSLNSFIKLKPFQSHMKQILFLILSVFSFASIQAQDLQNPDEYLGYPLGSKFSFHHKIVDYCKYIADKNPTKVKIIDYGKTFEGRPLLVAVIASPENLKNIEEIRKNNLRNIGLLDGKPSGSKIPAIAWLSYNVHGNEAVSSEAVLKVMYELLNPQNTLTQNILKNTIVILDPCINPDGRDRYAQWYNRVANQGGNPDPFSIEHKEPWPGGRFSHYLFDPNRDWAWQTQEISQQRLRLYNQWMPHLHADFHEMGIDRPYYFPPSAKPYHEDLSQWQRKFQQILGDYSKKYFDSNYWLYFSKENYDLLYPSYGDTYPSYNGAIGMTFEQGGGGPAGLAIAKSDGDTLTLSQRISHHFATSMGTLEAISTHADKTVEEFNRFFTDKSQNGYGVYKTFVFKNKGDESKINALTGLMDKLQIQYNFAQKESQGTGFSYQTQKDESFKIETNDLIISTYQPKGTFVKILFEPKTALEDSITYDLTSWSLAYAYQLKAFACKEKIVGGKKIDNTAIGQKNEGKPYAYLVPYRSFEEVKFLAKILSKGIKVRFNENPFVSNGQSFDTGSLIITRTNNERLGENFDKIIQNAASELQVSIFTTYSGMVDTGNDFGSEAVNIIKNPKIALLSGDGIVPTAFGEVWHYFEQQIKYPVSVIEGNSLSRIKLDMYDILILPDGNYEKILGTGDIIRKWLLNGGKLIALEGATGYFVNKDGYSLKNKKDQEKDSNEPMFRTYANREREAMKDQIPGAIYKVELDKTHPLGYGTNGIYYALVRDVYNYDFSKNLWNVGYLKDNNYVSGFVGSKAKEKMKNTLIFGVEEIGKGKIIYMADSPYFEDFGIAVS